MAKEIQLEVDYSAGFDLLWRVRKICPYFKFAFPFD